MHYNSTRDVNRTVTPAEAVLQGLAADGGLYITDPAALALDAEALLQKDYRSMAADILGALLPDYPADRLRGMIDAAYGRFFVEEVAPTVPVGPASVLELFHGPTAAFKDVALTLLPHLITGARDLLGSKAETVILTATSGDTGKAALEGFRDVAGTRIIVFYPRDGVSAIQRCQMVTQQGANTCVCAVEGNFDDAQTGVKQIFGTVKNTEKMTLSSANSINIGRLAPQIVYYWKAYADLLQAGRIRMGEKVNFVVPTGNFGNILAGYLARAMGLPVGKLVCASNANDVLTEFLTSGRYDRRRPFYRTTSPSMDILVSSNLERLLYLASGGDAAAVAGYMAALQQEGFYQVEDALLNQIREVFLCGCCNDDATAETIRRVWEKEQYLLDPHTAVAWNVYEQVKDSLEGETVILSTASPYKFAPAVLAALGETVPEDEFDSMDALTAKTGVAIPLPLANLRDLAVRHRDCIPKDTMIDYVCRKMEENEWNK